MKSETMWKMPTFKTRMQTSPKNIADKDSPQENISRFEMTYVLEYMSQKSDMVFCYQNCSDLM